MILDANIVPRRPSLVIARLSSSAALSGACMGNVAMPVKRLGFSFTNFAIWSFWIAAVAAPRDASWLYRYVCGVAEST